MFNALKRKPKKLITLNPPKKIPLKNPSCRLDRR